VYGVSLRCLGTKRSGFVGGSHSEAVLRLGEYWTGEKRIPWASWSSCMAVWLSKTSSTLHEMQRLSSEEQSSPIDGATLVIGSSLLHTRLSGRLGLPYGSTV